jgi:hypothetical protein
MPELILAPAATAALGLVSRLRPVGWPRDDKSLGDVLDAVAVYLVLALLPSRRALVAALALCLAVEAFQATGVPARWAAHLPPVRLPLGTSFSWHDVGCCFTGVGVISAGDTVLLRPRRGEEPARAGEP